MCTYMLRTLKSLIGIYFRRTKKFTALGFALPCSLLGRVEAGPAG